jgi:hypothetical protein
VFHHQRAAIEAHMTVALAAVAISRHLQDTTGTGIKKAVRTARTIGSAAIEVDGQQLTLELRISEHAKSPHVAIEGHQAQRVRSVLMCRRPARSLARRRATRA